MIFIQKCCPSHYGTVAPTRPSDSVFHIVFFLQQKREDLLVTTLRRSRRRSRLKVRLLGLVGPDPNSDQLLSEVQLHSKRTCESLQSSDRGGGGSGSGSVLALFTTRVKLTRSQISDLLAEVDPQHTDLILAFFS